MDGDTITIKIPRARQKLQVHFPQDPKGDLRLVFKSKSFNLQKAFLRLESGYFKRTCTPIINLLEIKENFQEEVFSKVMSCFYGATIEVQRFDLPQYYPVIRFLEIEELINFVRKDILQYIEHYELFEVMKIAHQYSDQQLFEVCLEQLQKQSFEQLHYHQFEILQTDLPLFKLIIKTHNRHRANGGVGLPFTSIDKLLKDYCENRTLGEEKYHELKFQLIDKTALTSEEYKKIFLDEAIKFKNKASLIIEKNNSGINSSGQGLNKLVTHNLAESVLSPVNVSANQVPQSASFPNITMANEITLEMQNTFEKKRNEELRSENRYLAEQLQNLKNMTIKNQDIHDQMQNQLKMLKDQLKRKEQQEQQHKRAINKFETIINKLQRELEEQTATSNRLALQFEEIKNRKPISDDGLEDPETVMVQSQFLPAHLIGEMMSEAKKMPEEPKPKIKEKRNESIDQTTQKIDETLDDEELQALYLPRLNFDDEPVSAPKMFLPRLANFMSGQGFNKRILTLIYRRSTEFPSKGANSDIYDKQNLLIIINTVADQVVGGFVSVTIPRNGADYLQDKEAFIFSLSKNHKFNVKKDEQAEAIFLTDQYLISFGNDLMIAEDCLNEESYCSWPTCYQGIKSTKERGSFWLVGGEDSHFKIKSIDIYEVTEGEMEMMIID